jgi:ribosome-binding factor A
VVDKPGGLTSHDVVARVRRLAGTRKVGHAGTLDPMATGVLVVGVERATRLLGHLMLTEKAYDATVRLGASTVTDDAEGDVVATADASAVTDEALRSGVARLTGDTQQATIFYTVFGEQAEMAASAAALESAKGLIRSEVGKQLGTRHVPTLEFIHDALPENARHLDELLARARESDAEVAAHREGAAYAGEPDPYRKPREDDEDQLDADD